MHELGRGGGRYGSILGEGGGGDVQDGRGLEKIGEKADLNCHLKATQTYMYRSEGVKKKYENILVFCD